jgi:hypothetical protein
MGRPRDDVAARPNFHSAVTASDVDESLYAPTCLALESSRLASVRVVAHPFEAATSGLGLPRPVHRKDGALSTPGVG